MDTRIHQKEKSSVSNALISEVLQEDFPSSIRPINVENYKRVLKQLLDLSPSHDKQQNIDQRNSFYLKITFDDKNDLKVVLIIKRIGRNKSLPTK